MVAESEFENLEMIADYWNKVEPLKYVLKLILGIICVLLSLNWIVQMYLPLLFPLYSLLKC